MLAPLNVRLPEELVARVRAESERSGVPQARIVRRALEDYLTRVEPFGEVVARHREATKHLVREEPVRVVKTLRMDPPHERAPQGAEVIFRCPRGCKDSAKVLRRCRFCPDMLVPA